MSKGLGKFVIQGNDMFQQNWYFRLISVSLQIIFGDNRVAFCPFVGSLHLFVTHLKTRLLESDFGPVNVPSTCISFDCSLHS